MPGNESRVISLLLDFNVENAALCGLRRVRRVVLSRTSPDIYLCINIAVTGSRRDKWLLFIEGKN